MKKLFIIIAILVWAGTAWAGPVVSGSASSTPATEAVAGVSRFCTAAEVTAGVTGGCIVDDVNLKTELDKKQNAATGLTASKPVCTSGTSTFAVCAGTEGVWATAASVVDWTADQGATNIHAGNIPDLSGTYQAADADFPSLAAGISGPVVGLGNGNGYRNIASTDLLPSDEIVAGGGTVDAITANYTIDKTLADKTIARFRSAGANTSTTPSFAPDGLTAHTIVKHGGVALSAGDIGAAGMICVLQYDLANTRWELMNPVKPSGTLALSEINAPSSDSDPSTTPGQFKHDSTDTGSNSGGTFKWYDGAQVRSFVDTGTNYTIITKTEYLPIRYAEDGTTAPSAAAEISTTTAIGRSFSEGDDVVFWWVIPNDYIGGVKYRVIYALSADASADETVVFSMAGSVVANSGALAGAAGTALTIADELTTDDDQFQVMMTDYSAESNADWSLMAGGLARLEFSSAAAGDYAGGEPLVIGIEIKYKAKIIGIAGY
ncbi:MAG: hypothetical protein PHV74_13975 [Dehalococcoidia bacterium]|nr:hypothetical protein [Dehalococcoidia bacterium]